MSGKGKRRGLSLLAMFMLMFSAVSVVAADSGDPTKVNAVVNGSTVTLSGTWAWPRCEAGKDSDRWIGWAVDWDVPGFTGNPLPGENTTFNMGEPGTWPGTAAAPTQGNHVFSPLDQNLPSNCANVAGTGPFGPISHTYTAPGTYHPCVVIYDLTANATSGNHSRLAGGDDRNKDNSVEANNTDIENCAPVTIIIPSVPGLTTQVSTAVTDLNATVTDVATLTETNNNGQVTGEVDFFVCFNAAAKPDCSAGGADAGQNKSVNDVSAANNNGSATSNSVQLTQVGFYCFRAEYDSLTSLHYLDTKHTNTTTECVQVLTPPVPPVKSLVVDKTNNAPLVGGVPTVTAGATVLYTLAYDVSPAPVTSGIITDVVPAGLEYVAGSATSNATFSFQGYNATTRTLTWTAPTVATDGSVAYSVVVQAGAASLPQPRNNVVVIDSADTNPVNDISPAFVPAPPAAATAAPVITLPPTDVSAADGSSSPATSLPLVLAALGALIVGLSLVAVPGTIRRRNRR